MAKRVRQLTLSSRNNATDIETTVELMLRRATKAGASHLHIEPRGGYGVVRQRVGTNLELNTKLPGPATVYIVDYFKKASGLDVADRQKPQNGRYELIMGRRHYDVEVGTLPLLDGESMSLRFVATVPKSSSTKTLDRLTGKGRRNSRR